MSVPCVWEKDGLGAVCFLFFVFCPLSSVFWLFFLLLFCFLLSPGVVITMKALMIVMVLVMVRIGWN